MGIFGGGVERRVMSAREWKRLRLSGCRRRGVGCVRRRTCGRLTILGAPGVPDSGQQRVVDFFLETG
jgi:hypothetical protein